ncbi:unnamed protein product [Ceutorhynchus assimilis]|uniref:Uncharacterized protein n=1 Tax=Ceutorhynchus assimilis TaxID=467358 RepID=A0A9N9QNU7_9CUCU|nr:unnamed protein product [Ceutorhynchus assimilis]
MQTLNGQFNSVGKRLLNVPIPESSDDATTKQYMLEEIHKSCKELAQTINKIYQATHDSLISIDGRIVKLENKIEIYDAKKESIVKKIADLEKTIRGGMKNLLVVEKKANNLIAASKIRI